MPRHVDNVGKATSRRQLLDAGVVVGRGYVCGLHDRTQGLLVVVEYGRAPRVVRSRDPLGDSPLVHISCCAQ